VTRRLASIPVAVCTAASLGVIASSFSTAKADPPSSQIIPGSPPPASIDELALPYDAWQGPELPPPASLPPHDLPLPLARPPELARRPLELGLALATFLPSCQAGSIDDSGCQSAGPGAGLDAALLYRVSPFFGVGAEAVGSGFGGHGHGALSHAGGSAAFVGIVGRVYFADAGAWDPYLALTLGGGWLSARGVQPGETREATNGLGARVALGIDFLLGSRLRFGPAVSFAHWLVWSEQRCDGSICSSESSSYGRLLGFATLGVRVTASFGDAL
jgi:hypothetical protein